MHRTKSKITTHIHNPEYSNSSSSRKQFHKRTVSFNYLEDQNIRNKRTLRVRESSKKSIQVTGHGYSDSQGEPQSCRYLQNPYCEYSPLIFPCYASVNSSFKSENYSLGELKQDLSCQINASKNNLSPLIITPYKIVETDIKRTYSKILGSNLSIKSTGNKQPVNTKLSIDAAYIFTRSFEEKIRGSKVWINSYKDCNYNDISQENRLKTAKCNIRIDLPSTHEQVESLQAVTTHKVSEHHKRTSLSQNIQDPLSLSKVPKPAIKSRIPIELAKPTQELKNTPGRSSSIQAKLNTSKETIKPTYQLKLRSRKTITPSTTSRNFKPVHPKRVEETQPVSLFRRLKSPSKEVIPVKCMTARKKRSNIRTKNLKLPEKALNQSWEWSSYEDSRLC